MKDYIDTLIKWLAHNSSTANNAGLVVGLSGGIDSAVVSRLIQQAVGEKAYALILPCHSSIQDIEDAQKVVTQFGLNAVTIDLTDTYDILIKSISFMKTESNQHAYERALGNIKARLRMTTLYAFAQTHHALVVGTDNKAEWHTGYFTKFGDGGVDLAPMLHLLKREVVAMAKYLDVPKDVIEKAPTAGLYGSQTDEEEMGVTYQVLDNYLAGDVIDAKSQLIIETLYHNSQHKRKMPVHPCPPLEVLKGV